MIIIKLLEKSFIKHKNFVISQKQAAYMKNISPFLGLQKPLRASLQKSIFEENKLTAEQLKSTVKILFNKNEREYCYAALDLLISYKKFWTEDFFELFNELVQIKPWWDTIDTIAVNCIGVLIQKYPELVNNMDTWIKSNSMWKKRVAIIYQLKYKKNTEIERLNNYYKLTMHEREFFIAKAIGWSLREYSKTDPVWVREFLNKHKNQLAPLTIHEGSKYC